MEIYTLFLFLSILVSVLSYYLPTSAITKFLVFCLMVAISFIVAFRSKYIGVDTITYFNYFSHPQLGFNNMDEIAEPGYRLYQYLFKRIWNDPYAFLAITSLLSLSPIWYLITKESRNKGLSLFLFLTLATMTTCFFVYLAAVRQCLAISILLWGIIIYYKNGFRVNKYSLLLFAIACSIHFSIIIYLPFIFVNRLKIKKYILMLILIASFIFGMLLPDYINTYITFASDINKGYYLEIVKENQYTFTYTLPLMLIALCYLLTPLDNYFDKFFITGVIFNNMFSLAGDSVRLCLPFFIIGMISIPNLIMNKRIPKIIPIPLMIVILLFYSVISQKILHAPSSTDTFFPYKTYVTF